MPYPDQSFDAATCIGLLMHLDAEVRVRALRELARVSRGPLVVQYGCVDVFQRLSARMTGVPPGGVRCPVSEKEMRMDSGAQRLEGARPVLGHAWSLEQSHRRAHRDRIDKVTDPVRFVADSYYRGLRAVGLPARRRRLNDAGVILCYHNVVATEEDCAGCPGLHEPRARFERQVRWLAEHYHVVGLSEFIGRLTSGASLRSVAALTFDDGYAGVFEHAVPILHALGIPATVFIVADAVGASAPFPWDECADHRPADWAVIRGALGRGIELGAHSCNHPSLPGLDDSQLEHEIVASRAVIHGATGAWPEFFAYPFGHWNPRVR